MKTTTIKNTKVIPEMINVPYEEGHYRFWEKRMHLDDIFDELALPWNTTIDVVDMGKTIIAYCKENIVMPLNVSWGVEDGLLYANGNIVKRVGPKDTAPACDKVWNYLEKHIGYANFE